LGPNGAEELKKFISHSKFLKVLDVTNCGLGPIGGAIIGDALFENEDLKLEEIYASRGRLEEGGMISIARALGK
jgi:Ran GTPase-activating protein (RanGAP) involved in mRNA processing and transport